jgi:prepilin-type N-terminal cleavage/methylation domain-containing protein
MRKKSGQAPLPTVFHRGFTLVELMVTLTVIAIVAALAAPSLMMLAPDMALRSAARDLYAKLHEAKMRAIKESSRISIRFNGAYYYIDADGDNAYTPSAVDTFTDTNGDGVYNPGEPFADVDGNKVYSGEIAINFTDYGYGVDRGTGNAIANWNNDPCTQAGVITFNSRGTSGSGTIYLENRNRDISYAVTVVSAGSIRIRKYSGATPFNRNFWK